MTDPVYLTEKNLDKALQELFPSRVFIRNKIVPNSGIRNRADFRNDKLRLIIEFDGYRHYSESKIILIDQKKDSTYSNLGFSIVRIPYFVQLSSQVIKDLFQIDISYKQKYFHGFIDEKAMLPVDYCELGIKRFQKDIERFQYIKKDIIRSLERKIEICGDKRLVLPESLFGLLN